MFHNWQLTLLPLSVALLTAGDQPQPWKDKQVADWNDDDAKLILTDSPWAKTVKPAVEPAANNTQRMPASRGRGGMGGIGIGLPGMGGMGRRGGMGYPGGGYPGGTGYPTGSTYPGGTGYPGGQPGEGTNGGANTANQPPQLTLRWESAQPIREAVLKTRDTNAPTLDGEQGERYALAVYGVPGRMVNVDSKTLAARLKDHASIKRDGKKDLRPTKVLVLERDSGPVFVYLFARSKKAKIQPEDQRIEFDAKIGPLTFERSFFLEDMVYKGKLEI